MSHSETVNSLPLWLLVVIFAVAAAVVWVAGIQLSKTTDVLDAKLHLGSALGGLIMLGVATNLPEIAITVAAAISGNVDIAVGNILGGIALQTVVLVLLDLFGKRGREVKPLTYRAASLTLLLEAVVVVGILGIVVAGTQLPEGLIVAGITPAGALIVVAWIVGLVLVKRAGTKLPWHEDGKAPDAQPHPSGHRRRQPPAMSTAKASVIFVIAALATLAAGVALERTGEAASSQLGLSGILFGATILALATSLPEISTGIQSIRQGDDNLAVSDIFGGNGFLPVLLFVAAIITGKAVLPHANASDIYLCALGILLTLVYAIGLLLRPQKKIAGMGVDSLIVLILYLAGVAGLFAISAAG